MRAIHIIMQSLLDTTNQVQQSTLRLKEVRKQNGLSQVESAEVLGVHSMTVSRWETSFNYPDIRILAAIATLFDVSSDYLLGIRDEKK